ncbi:MAG: CPBP family intramembrane metalloprotease [Ignavibacteriales bacterium]|nr:CPBP family intramembrane metalloprotease [Ignavibacteriales bacterium]
MTDALTPQNEESGVPASRPDVSERDSGEPAIPPSFVERHNISPVAFAVLSLIGIFVLYQVGGGVLAFLAVGGGGLSSSNADLMRWLTLAGQTAFILIPTLLLGKMFSRSLADVFPFRLPSIAEIVLAIVGLLSLQRIFEVYSYLQKQIPMPQRLEELFEPVRKLIEQMLKALIHADTVPQLLVVVFIVAVAPAFIEELMFRGLIQSAFQRSMPPVHAAVWCGVIFGFFHVNPFDVIPLMGLGVFLSFLRFRSMSLWIPILVHLVNNALAVVAEYLRIDDNAMLSPIGPMSPTIAGLAIQTLFFGGLFVWCMTAYLRVTRRGQDQTEAVDS